jgi:multicomponent K+:H+ antiporter subunit A
VVLVGLSPNVMIGWLLDPAASATTGETVATNIYHWHGLDAVALWMSLAPSAGAWSSWVPTPAARAVGRHPAARGEAHLRRAGRAPGRRRPQVTEALHNGRFSRSMVLAVLAIAGPLGRGLPDRRARTPGTRPLLPVDP